MDSTLTLDTELGEGRASRQEVRPRDHRRQRPQPPGGGLVLDRSSGLDQERSGRVRSTEGPERAHQRRRARNLSRSVTMSNVRLSSSFGYPGGVLLLGALLCGLLTSSTPRVWAEQPTVGPRHSSAPITSADLLKGPEPRVEKVHGRDAAVLHRAVRVLLDGLHAVAVRPLHRVRDSACRRPPRRPPRRASPRTAPSSPQKDWANRPPAPRSPESPG